jgi:hypothetical protein
MESQNNIYRFLQLKQGYSPSYLPNNLTKSENFLAYLKNTFTKSRVIIYKMQDLEDRSADVDEIAPISIIYESVDYELTHVNYLHLNSKYYLLVGYVGGFEIHSEDGSRKYFSGNSVSSELGKAAYLSSSVV